MLKNLKNTYLFVEMYRFKYEDLFNYKKDKNEKSSNVYNYVIRWKSNRSY